MAKKGRMKVSKVKRNNQTTNKMKKQGKLRLQRHRTKLQQQKQKQPDQPSVEYSSESDSASGDEWADMLDAEEQEYIMNRLAKEPGLLSNIPENETENTKKPKKRKMKVKTKNIGGTIDSGAESEDESNSELEENYEKEQAERPAKRLRPLLPIKTKEGLQERAEECEESEEENPTEIRKEQPESQMKSEQDSGSDSGLEGTVEEAEEEVPQEGVVSTVQLLAARRDKLRNDKLRIGALCSSLLESPEKKLKNLYPILYLMEEQLKDGAMNLVSVRKLATLSAYEVFRDILPDYQIRHQDYSNVKLKKDTLALYKYEKELLEFYKRYLQRLEKAASVLRRKKGDTRHVEETALSLALVSFRCMCGMLEARPQFNYATNIAQSVVPFLGCKEPRARELATQCCVRVFADDNRGEITLVIVRLINQLVKRLGDRLHPSALDCLLSLKIRDVELDAEADVKHKKKQEEKHKKRIVNLSKKEKKRSKKLKEVERELLETEAQESEMARRKQLTEVTKTVFHIYFRLLKTAPRSRLLAAVLDGLAKFTHVINLEYYTDLVTLLGRLMADEQLAARERLLCVRTALSILAGTGDALNVDPAQFHTHLYSNAIQVHAGRSEENARIVIEAVCQVCGRARRVSPAVLQAFGKRLATLCAQLSHHGALACLATLHQLTQQSKAVCSLFDTEERSGSGRFEPTLSSPEHCGAGGAAPHELCALRRHYHPTVRAAAASMLRDRTMPTELAKLSPMQILQQYDGSQMSFKPAIPPPKRAPSKGDKHSSAPHSWTQKSLKEYCETVESVVDLSHIQILGNKDKR